jgi:hypothetical protein
MRVVVTAVGPNYWGLADPIIHYITSVGHTSVRSAVPPICCGHIDRGTRRRLRRRGGCGFAPNGFAL